MGSEASAPSKPGALHVAWRSSPVSTGGPTKRQRPAASPEGPPGDVQPAAIEDLDARASITGPPRAWPRAPRAASGGRGPAAAARGLVVASRGRPAASTIVASGAAPDGRRATAVAVSPRCGRTAMV